jgi:hypothetical protein
MKLFLSLLLFSFVAGGEYVYAQQPSFDKVKFFADTGVLNARIVLNIKRIVAHRKKEGMIFPATFTCELSDNLTAVDNIEVQARGHFRRSYCYLPPLKLTFKNKKENTFYHLKSLKLVSTCAATTDDDQNLLSEYMVYKIYNLITDKSFRVRLLNLTYQDSSGRRKTYTQHAFLLEDIKEVAKRNVCDDWTNRRFATEATHRKQMTIVSLFEYMIGNTDWSVPVKHNIKFIHSNVDTLTRPYVVPYDFDFSGLVNTTYANPDSRLGIQTVRERLYRGFPRTLEEINEALEVFRQQKAKIYATINDFNLLEPITKKQLTDYLDAFYDTINSRSDVKDIFVRNARTE